MGLIIAVFVVCLGWPLIFLNAADNGINRATDSLRKRIAQYDIETIDERNKYFSDTVRDKCGRNSTNGHRLAELGREYERNEDVKRRMDLEYDLITKSIPGTVYLTRDGYDDNLNRYWSDRYRRVFMPVLMLAEEGKLPHTTFPCNDNDPFFNYYPFDFRAIEPLCGWLDAVMDYYYGGDIQLLVYTDAINGEKKMKWNYKIFPYEKITDVRRAMDVYPYDPSTVPSVTFPGRYVKHIDIDDDLNPDYVSATYNKNGEVKYR